MAKVKIYNAQGKSVGEKNLDDKVFGVKVNAEAVHEVVVSMRANARPTVANTKTRGEVSGGGKKPWKQKGTGRARQGSIRSPQWKGGGTIFGPRSERDYSLKVNRKAKRNVFCMVLSDKVANDKLVLIEKLETKGKTKEVAGVLAKLPVKGKTTLVVPKTDTLLTRGARNIPGIRTVTVNDIGLMDVMAAQYLVMTPEATDAIVARCSAKA
jgi:large subunit ribosomal protein L4